MKVPAVLLAISLVAVVAPFSSAEGECDNLAYFQDILNTRPDTYVAPAVDPFVREYEGPKHTGHADVNEREDRDDVVAVAAEALASHAGAACMEDMVSGGEETDDFPLASDFIILYELAFDFGGQHCNQGEEVGPGGHYAHAAEFPEEAQGNMPWSGSYDGSKEYAGVATSDISVAEGAYDSFGIATDMTEGKSFGYRDTIAYGGVSDFYCYGYFDEEFGDYVTINLPYVTGVASDY